MICAGLPRTGTLSLKAALTQLLGGRCYHGFDNLFGGQEDVDFWLTVANGSASDEEIREFFCARGCAAVADFPAAYFYTRLLKVFTLLCLRVFGSGLPRSKSNPDPEEFRVLAKVHAK